MSYYKYLYYEKMCIKCIFDLFKFKLIYWLIAQTRQMHVITTESQKHYTKMHNNCNKTSNKTNKGQNNHKETQNY